MSLDDTSYAAAAHSIMLAAIQRYIPTDVSADNMRNRDFYEKVKEHVRVLFESLLDLEP